MSDTRELHVLPHEHSGTWLVGLEHGSPVLSWHETANAAEVAARRHAAAHGAREIFVHDRYQRVRAVSLGASLSMQRQTRTPTQ